MKDIFEPDLSTDYNPDDFEGINMNELIYSNCNSFPA